MSERDELRCERNGKPCGTDTFREGHECECASCEMWRFLNEPTANQVMRDQRRGTDALNAALFDAMTVLGRAMAPQVNKILADLQKQIDEDKKPS